MLPDPREMAPHALSGLGSEWPARLAGHRVLWAGKNFGAGTGREASAICLQGAGVQVIGIALDTAEEARAFRRVVPVRFTLLLETPGPGDSSVRLGNARGVLPYTVLVDAQGRLAKTHYGAFPDVDAVRAWAGDGAPGRE